MMLQIFDILRNAVRCQITGRGAQDAAHRCEPSGHQAGIGELGDADRDVGAFRDDGDKAVAQHQVHRQVGIGAHEGFEMRCDMHTAKRGRRRHL